MPVPQVRKPESVNDGSSVRDNPILLGMSTLAVDEEEKYWKLKIVYSALESVIFNFDPNPKLPLEVLTRFRKILHDGAVHENIKEPLLTAETKCVLMTLIAREIENVAETLVKTQMELLKSSALDENRKWLLMISESENPLEEVLKIVQKHKQEENDLDNKINQAKILRFDELNKMEEMMNKVKQTIEHSIQAVAKAKQPEEVNRKFDRLKIKGDILALKTEMAQKDQLILENPPEVVRVTTASLHALSQVNEKLKSENDVLSTFISQHDALPSQMKAILTQLQHTDESIKRQEWILKSLNGYQESETVMEDSMNESFF